MDDAPGGTPGLASKYQTPGVLGGWYMVGYGGLRTTMPVELAPRKARPLLENASQGTLRGWSCGSPPRGAWPAGPHVPELALNTAAGRSGAVVMAESTALAVEPRERTLVAAADLTVRAMEREEVGMRWG